MAFRLFARRPISDEAFIAKQNEKLVQIYNAIVARRPAAKYGYGAAMLRGAIGSFDDARREK